LLPQFPCFFQLSVASPKTEKKERLALRFNEWQQFLENLEEHYRTIAELMILTGMIVSELAALRKNIIQGDYLKLISSYVLYCEKTSMKTACQSALKFDPPSASKNAPPQRLILV